ncbi:MAG TPA: aminotransferase class III-fold pyridoxal phosphate-dependent enzyme [Chloroflexota bacterium]|jgi:adenosylmethionine-8-amino-7-oxononanoate aminotransferase
MARSATRVSSFFPSIHGRATEIVRGQGVYLYDADDRRYIDGGGGVGGVPSIGHGVEEIVEAMAAQAREVAFIPCFQFVGRPVIELCDRIAAFSPGDLNRVMLLSGGSEAKEPFAPEVRAADRLARAAQERGLLLYPGTGTADGLVGEHVLLAPPLTITPAEVDELVAGLDGALEALAGELARA